MLFGPDRLRLLLPCLLVACADEPGDLSVELSGEIPGVVTSALEEGRTDPYTVPLQLKNGSRCALSYSIGTYTADSVGWLTVAPNAGVIPERDKTTVTVSIDVTTPAWLAPGTYSGSLTITGSCSDDPGVTLPGPTVVAVNLTVKPKKVAELRVGDERIDVDVVDVSTLVPAWTPTTLVDAPSPREDSACAWTGDNLLVSGGMIAGVRSAEAYLYDVEFDAWIRTPDMGFARAGHTATYDAASDAVWVWGGNIGFVNIPIEQYDVADNAFYARLASSPIGRYAHTAVPTSFGIIIWGGHSFGTLPRADGAMYFKDLDEWYETPLSPMARYGHLAIAAYERMYIWGGIDQFGQAVPAGAGFSPSLNTWGSVSATGAHTAAIGAAGVWTGKEWIIWGGNDGTAEVSTGAMYDPIADTWRPMSNVGAPSPRRDHVMVWTGQVAIVWGGRIDVGLESFVNLGDGGIFDPAKNQWSPLNAGTSPLPAARACAVWTGSEMIVHGGLDGYGGAMTTGGVLAFVQD